MTAPQAEQDYVSKTGRAWKWCMVRDCWQYENWKYKIFQHSDGQFTCSSYGVWHDGIFKTFEDAEQEMLSEGER